jgi:ribosomal protein S18 acetylase RimI-like enzyme
VHPIFKEIKPVFADSFLEVIRPYVYAKEPRLASYPQGKSSFVDGKVTFGIRDTMKRRLNKQLSQLTRDVKSNKIEAAYMAVARDTAHNVVGFALFKECVLADYVSPQLKKVIEGALVSSTKRDQLCVLYVAVAPEAQKKGIGKKLLFAGFDHCSQIKNIYLTTSADEFNKNAQDFFEHIGFKRVLKGEFTPDYNDAGFDKVKIVYGYTK